MHDAFGAAYSSYPQAGSDWRPAVYPTAVFQEPTYNPPSTNGPSTVNASYAPYYPSTQHLIDVDVNYRPNSFTSSERSYPHSQPQSQPQPPQQQRQIQKQAPPSSPRRAEGFGSLRGKVIEDGTGAYKFQTNIVDDSGYIEEVVVVVGMGGIKVMDKNQASQKKLYTLDDLHKWGIRDSDVMILTFLLQNGSAEDVYFRADRRTTGAMLDAVTATCVQLCELKGEPAPSISTENKDGMGIGWVKKCVVSSKAEVDENGQISKDHWRPDSEAKNCTKCNALFTTLRRRHHCRMCGDIFCKSCSSKRVKLLGDNSEPERVCDKCAEVHGRIAASGNQQMTANKISHEELTRKLQEDYDVKYAEAISKRETRKADIPREVQVITPNIETRHTPGNGPAASNYYSSANTNQYTGPPHLWTTEVGPPAQRHPSDRHVGVNDGFREQEVSCPSCNTLLQVYVGVQDTPVECGVCGSHFLVAGLSS